MYFLQSLPQGTAVSLCLISVNDDDGNRAEGASDVRGNKQCGVKQLLQLKSILSDISPSTRYKFS